jgi:molybdopterin synthase sulfur carrier subunit
MMKTVRLFATVRDIVGNKNISIPLEEGGTVRDLIRSIGHVYPELGNKLLDPTGQLSSVIHIYVGGRNVEWLEGMDTVIAENDDVFIVPPMAGG